ncbi:MAG: substrate-binding domain-containing protein [Anaerolineae bacterium]|nr:substrate-binding domain-containing protein [Anaerolineae bacterium]
MKRNLWRTIGALSLILIISGGLSLAAAQDTMQPDEYGEIYDADMELIQRALGTTEGVPDIALAAFYRAGLPVSEEMAAKALECWRDKVCDTGTGGEVVVALADGFGENVWREVTHMELILQALTYPEIGRLIYTSAQFDTQKAIADFRSLIAQDVDVIIGFPDAGDAMLPSVRQATERGIIYIPHSYGRLGEPGTDYPTYVAEDVCALGERFAEVLNAEVGSGKVAFLGGTPGNPLSAGWQNCEEAALSDSLELVARADTFWTREGTLEAVSGIITANPDVAGYSYEAADSFLGGIRAYEAAGLPLDITLTLRTDEVGLFCEWQNIGNPNFKIFYSTGGNYQSRIALTAAMMQLHGATLPAEVIIPVQMRQVDESSCIDGMPSLASVSSLVPLDIFVQMYPDSE